MRCFKTTLQQMLTASWLINKPHKYPWIPKTGIAKNTLPMRMASPDCVDRKRGCCFAKSVQDTQQRTVYIQKRTDPRQCDDKIAGQITGKQKLTDQLSEEQEKQTAEQSHEKTGAKYFLQQFSDAGCLVFDLKLGNCRHQHDRNRIGDGGRE